MGYYTDYTVSCDSTNVNARKNIQDELDKNPYKPYMGERFNAKWYDHDTDMINISRKFPDVTFILDGLGEDDDTPWRTYYKNGGIQEATVTISYSKCTL